MSGPQMEQNFPWSRTRGQRNREPELPLVNFSICRYLAFFVFAHIPQAVFLQQNFLTTAIQVILDQNRLSTDVDKLLELEIDLAQQYSTNDSVRRQYRRSWNPTNVITATNEYGFVDFAAYFAALATNYPELDAFFKTPAFQFSAMEPEMFKKLSTDFATQFDSNVVANYFFYRLLAANREYLPKPVGYRMRTKQPEQSGFGRRPRPGRSFEMMAAAKYTDVQTQCAYESVYAMQFATGRIFADYRYPSAATVQRINRQVFFE